MYYFIKRILLASNKLNSKSNKVVIAFTTAFLFAIHPFNVESVAWISASKILVYAFFYLLALHGFLSFLLTKNILYYLLTYILFLASFLGKEQAVTLPICLLVVACFVENNLKKRDIGHLLLPFFIAALFMGITTLLSQQVNGEGVLTDNATYPLGQRLILACYTFVEYLLKTVFPVNLLYIYPFPITVGENLPTWILIYPFALFFIAFAFWKYIRKAPILFGLAFFTVHLLTVLHLIPMSRYAIVTDRYAYLSTIGICFILSHYVVQLYFWINKKCKIAVIGISTAYLFGLGMYAHFRTFVWHDTNSLKKEVRELLMQRSNYNSEFKNLFINH